MLFIKVTLKGLFVTLRDILIQILYYLVNSYKFALESSLVKLLI